MGDINIKSWHVAALIVVVILIVFNQRQAARKQLLDYRAIQAYMEMQRRSRLALLNQQMSVSNQLSELLTHQNSLAKNYSAQKVCDRCRQCQEHYHAKDCFEGHGSEKS